VSEWAGELKRIDCRYLVILRPLRTKYAFVLGWRCWWGCCWYSPV